MTNDKPCCTPSTGRTLTAESESVLPPNTQEQSSENNSDALNLPVLQIPGGDALIGTDQPMIAIDEEAPCKRKHLDPFKIMQTAVTNALYEAPEPVQHQTQLRHIKDSD